MFLMPWPLVEPTAVAKACRLLGWEGVVTGPVDFGGVQFWASAQLDADERRRRDAAGSGAVCDRRALELELASFRSDALNATNICGLRPPLRLTGCLVAGLSPRTAVRDASMLAGYAPRAVLVPDDEDILGLLADAALLDQGVVLYGAADVNVLAHAGPRVAGGGFDAREWELLERVYDAVLTDALVVL